MSTKENEINPDVTNLKYGDADVCSKRRKLHDIEEQDEDGQEKDEQEKKFKLIRDANISLSGYNESYVQFEKNANENCCQSSFLETLTNTSTIANNQCQKHIVVPSPTVSSCSQSPLNPLTSQETETSAKNNLTITNKPSVSSKGFENTFKLLQHQVEANTQKTIDLLKTINPEKTVPKVLPSSSSESCSYAVREDEPSCFELELEAMQRIQAFVNDLEAEAMEECIKTRQVSTTLLTLLYNFVSKSLSQNVLEDSTFILQSTKIFNDASIGLNTNLMYHVGKDTSGAKCLKIVRNLLNHEEVLCGNRVSQMTRAYDDIEAVTRLLEEKEKDLELTVQIGKELLTQNNLLENRLAELEADLKYANEDRSQLVHELHKKNELIAVLTNDGEDASDNDTPTFSKSITLDLLQKKVTTLQDENRSLKVEASQLACQTDEVEEHERQLMNDISSQLYDANKQFEGLSLELERQREENRLQHEQIVSLTARLSEAEMRLHQLTHDNDEHVTLLNITKENQNSLALELVEFKQRYQEVLALLQETQEQLRKHRKKIMPQARSSFMSTLGMLQPDSLQSELMESSLYSENSIDSGISGDNQRINDRVGRVMSQYPSDGGCDNRTTNSASVCALSGGPLPPYKRVFDTVRCATKIGNFADSECTSMTHLGAMSMSSASGPRMSTMAFVASANQNSSSFYRDNDILGMGMGVKTLSCESLASQSDDGYPTQPSGVPGAPGAKELEAALKRLTPAEVLARRAMLSYGPAGTYSYDEQQTTHTLPLGVRTPDSIMSTGSSGISSSTNMSSSMHQWRLPEKLQIVKPIEGSQTLHHWSRLATPTLSGLLEERPGVTIRGGRGLDDLGMQVYTLSDVEEDVSDELPGKQFEFSGCTYTFTTSTVMHPDDGLITDLSFLSQSQVSSRMASTSTSRQPSCPATPRAGLSRKNSCSTFSVNLGLASMLNERGIKAVTPSALNTPAGPNFSPTVTPCNSPEGSPTRSMSPEPLFSLLSSGADLIRRKLVGGDIERPNRNQQQKQQKIMITRLERRALRSLRLVEKVESIGLENIISYQPNTMSQLASGIANRSASPMAQLTSLKNVHTSSNKIVSDLHFDRNQIKDVLQKGLHSQQREMHPTVSSSSHLPAERTSSSLYVNMRRDNTTEPIHQQHKVDDDAQSTTDSTMTGLEFNSSVRVKQMQRQKSRRNLKNGQRPDLGTIEGRVRTDLGRVSPKKNDQPLNTRNNSVGPRSSSSKHVSTSDNNHDTKETQQSITQSFVGTVSSLLFGRKGGWL